MGEGEMNSFLFTYGTPGYTDGNCSEDLESMSETPGPGTMEAEQTQEVRPVWKMRHL